jgi:hypothetical protein
MLYEIQPYSFKIAKKLKVILKPTRDNKHTIDIYDNDNKYITSIGALGMNDYEIYFKNEGQKIAKEKRTLYYNRHLKDLKIKNSRGYYAWVILWRGNLS